MKHVLMFAAFLIWVMSWRALAEAIQVQVEGQLHQRAEPDAWRSSINELSPIFATDKSNSASSWQRLARQIAGPSPSQPDPEDHEDSHFDNMSLFGSNGSDYPMTEGDHQQHEQEHEHFQGM